MTDIEDRLRRLEDEQQLRALLAKYSFTADLGMGAEYTDLFMDDAFMDVGPRQPPGRFVGKKEIRELFFDGQARSAINLNCQHHSITGPLIFFINGEEAVAEGYSLLVVRSDHEKRRIRIGHGMHDAIHLAGANFSRWEFRRVNGSWRIVGRTNREMGTPEAAALFRESFA
jgi:hypothetical protein